MILQKTFMDKLFINVEVQLNFDLKVKIWIRGSSTYIWELKTIWTPLEEA